MMKIICLVSLVYMFAIGSEAWVRLPRVHVPRIRLPRLRLPRLRFPRFRGSRVRLPVIHPKRCGDQMKNNCGSQLVTRVVSVCANPSCRIFGKRSIESQDFPDRKYFI